MYICMCVILYYSTYVYVGIYMYIYIYIYINTYKVILNDIDKEFQHLDERYLEGRRRRILEDIYIYIYIYNNYIYIYIHIYIYIYMYK